jgi:hypothetical protein
MPTPIDAAVDAELRREHFAILPELDPRAGHSGTIRVGHRGPNSDWCLTCQRMREAVTARLRDAAEAQAAQDKLAQEARARAKTDAPPVVKALARTPAPRTKPRRSFRPTTRAVEPAPERPADAVWAVQRRARLANQFSVREKLLLAALDLERTTRASELVFADLAVRAWELYPEAFALGDKPHPHAGRVQAKLAGTSGLAGKDYGWLAQVRELVWAITPKGRQHARRILREAKDTADANTAASPSAEVRV